MTNLPANMCKQETQQSYTVYHAQMQNIDKIIGIIRKFNKTIQLIKAKCGYSYFVPQNLRCTRG